jgi:hypothetical protein
MFARRAALLFTAVSGAAGDDPRGMGARDQCIE